MAGPYFPQKLAAGAAPSSVVLADWVRTMRYQQGTPLSGDSERPIAVLRQTVAQSIPSNANQALLFDSEFIDTANGHSTTTNTSRWTCPAGEAGWYWVKGQYAAASNSTGDRMCQLITNSTTVFAKASSVALGSHPTYLNCSDLIYLAVGDFVETSVYQNSGGSLNTDLATAVTMAIYKMRMQ